MKVVLIQPPIRDFYRTKFREYPLGLLSIAATLKAEGHAVIVIDARLCRRPRVVNLPNELRYLSNYYTKANGIFLGYKHFGIDYEEIAEQVRLLKPDIVGICALFTPYVGEVIETARAIKAKMKSLKVLVGGHHATSDPVSIISTGVVDDVIKGEGEKSFVKYIKSGRYDEDDQVVGDLDTLRFPARYLIDPSNYRIGKKPYTMIMTSRGCPHRCSFCSTHSIGGYKYRTRSVENVLAEIAECVDKYHIRAIDLQDDNLLYDEGRAHALFEALIQRYEHRDIEFMATNGLNVSHLSEGLLRLMVRLGFKKLDLAIATGEVSSRLGLNRPETIEKYENVLENCKHLNIPVTTYVIIGIPTQPIGEQIETIEYLMQKDTLIAPSIFYNVPGMPVFEAFKQYEYLQSHIARRSSAFNNLGCDFTRDDVFKLFLKILRYNRGKTVNSKI